MTLSSDEQLPEPAMNNDPLYPTLTEDGEREAQLVMNRFKAQMEKIAKDVIGETLGQLYCDVPDWIGTDSWANYRNTMLEGFKGYKQYSAAHPYDFAQLRQAIYENNKEEIVRDLNQDLVEENKKLKEQIEWLQQRRFM